jgi:Domain of unknown function (DUF4159)
VKKLFGIVVFLTLLSSPGASQDPPKSSEFTFARVQFTQRRWTQYWLEIRDDPTSPGPPWWHDWPFSDEFVTALLRETTGVHTTPESHQIVNLDDPEIFKYPFLYFSEPGFMQLTDVEVKNLGEYIRRGGFIMADDFREPGMLPGDPDELEILRHYLSRAVPEYKLVRLDVGHPIFHQFFDITTLDMDPPYSYANFRPQFWGLSDEGGRLRLIASYNNDLGDYWENLDKGEAPLRPAVWATQLGVNYVIYAMSH